MSSMLMRRGVISAGKRIVASNVAMHYAMRSAVKTTPFVMNSKMRQFSSAFAVGQEYTELKQALFNKLHSEVELEEQAPLKISEEDAAFLQDEGFKLSHATGEKIVTLEKRLSDGKNLKVYFDCTELNDIHSTANEQEEVVDETEEAVEEEFEDDLQNSLLNVNLILENPATDESFVAHCYLSYQDLEFFPQSFQIIKGVELANSLSAESQQLKLSKYNGPGFQMLDEELQELFEAMFVNLGCNEQLGEFIVNYSTVAENDEYINWLNDLQKFFK